MVAFLHYRHQIDLDFRAFVEGQLDDSGIVTRCLDIAGHVNAANDVEYDIRTAAFAADRNKILVPEIDRAGRAEESGNLHRSVRFDGGYFVQT